MDLLGEIGKIERHEFRAGLVAGEGGVFEDLLEDGGIGGLFCGGEEAAGLLVFSVLQGHAAEAEDPSGGIGVAGIEGLQLGAGLVNASHLDEEEEAFIR